jgi:hypothetical protein
MHRNVTQDPSPVEIQQACKAIQKGWSERVRQQRAGLIDEDREWTIPVYLAVVTPNGVKYVREDGGCGHLSDTSEV